MTRISISIPTLNEFDYLPLQLDSFSKQTMMPFELIYVDGGSTDKTVSLIEDFVVTSGQNVKYVVKKDMGIDASHNFGASISHGDVVLFTNADILFPPRTLELIANHFNSDSELVALTGMPIPTMAPLLLRFEYQTWNSLKLLFSCLPRPFKTFITSSSFVAVRTETFLNMGGFNDEYVNSDGEFGMRLMERRAKVAYCPEIVYYTSSRRYVKVGAREFNRQFFYNTVENFFPVLTKASFLDGFRRALKTTHKSVT